MKTPTIQPPATPKSNAPNPKHATCTGYSHVLTSACIRCANTIRKSETKVAAANAVQYISRLKFFGFPFHAAYPIAAAIDGTTTKKVRRSSAASTHKPVSECMTLEE